MIKRPFVRMHIVAIAIVSMFFSCVDSEKDLYDPSYQTSNPLGEGFAAPEGFNWAMTTTKTVTVEVNDEYNGSYFYTIEIYDENPLANDNALLLGKGVAKKGQNFVTSISLNQNQEGIYVKQTDPKGRVEVYLFDAPEDSNNITCKLYYTEIQSNALKTRAALATTRATAIEKPDYTTIPNNAIEITSVPPNTNLQSNTSYKITSTYSGAPTYWGGSSNVKLYINATWNVPDNFVFQSGIEVIIMGSGKIVAGSHNLQFNGESMMTIMDNGTVSTNNITFSNGTPAGLRNWGTLAVANTITVSAGASLYNIGTLTSKSLIINSGSHIINNNSIAIEGDTSLPSNFTLENNGTITGNKLTGSSAATITNNNAMTFNDIDLTNTTVYNNCSMEAKTSFSANGVNMTFEKGYLKAPVINFINGTTKLNNGSMLDATSSLSLSGTQFIASGSNASLIKAPTVTGQGFTYDGNMAIESDHHVAKEQYWDNYHIINGAYLTKLGESKVYIEVCTGIKNGGNGGTDPTNPTFPIIVDDNHQYTYTFEDQWPLYGDYDMNDVVMIIKNRKYTLDNANKVKEFTFSIDLDAVGATKSIAAAIMFDAVPASAISEAVLSDNNLVKSFNLSNKNIENGQEYTVVPLFDNAHAALGRSKYEPINTVNGYASNTNAKNISFTIKFATPSLTAEAFNINKLNLFIIVEGNSSKRREIHVAGYQPTKLANTDLFGGNNDASSVSGKKYYISKDNLAWGILAPTNFKWALEYTNIKVAYSKFVSWVSTGGKENQNWWNDFNEAKVFQTNKN